MRFIRLFLISTLTVSSLVLLDACSDGAEVISVETELYRMRTTDHLFSPQTYMLKQYSGFHREGLNPDRLQCLYEVDGWRVVADWKGKGVVSRIWTTNHNIVWGDIKVEVDDKIIYEGDALKFFNQEKIPFVQPVSAIFEVDEEESAWGNENEKLNKWAVSYVPIPFTKRFRFMQKDTIYTNINIKEFPEETRIVSFNDTDWEKLESHFNETSNSWKNFPLSKDDYGYISLKETMKVPASKEGAVSEIELADITEKGVIRGIKLKLNDESIRDSLNPERSFNLCVYWDNEMQPSICSPVLHGFGSFKEQTMALGTSEDKWQYMYFPGPFMKNARVTVKSNIEAVVSLSYEIIYEKVENLSPDFLYLRSYANTGIFRSGVDSIGNMEYPIGDFFYNVGYSALDITGTGHVVAYLDLFHCQPELDEHIFIDDERIFPDNSWNGTGHEDLFDMAWGHKPRSTPMTSGGSEEFDEVNVKLFWSDPMPFRKAVKFNWEWSYKFAQEPPRDARFASVVYFYSKP